MPHLRPCVHCARHVRSDESECPFCQGALAIETEPPPMPRGRIGRAAIMAFGTAVATAAVVACGDSNPKPNDPSKTSSGSSVGNTPTDSATATATPTSTEAPTTTATVPIAKPYGAPPAEGLFWA